MTRTPSLSLSHAAGPIRLAIVSDDPLVHAGLRRLLGGDVVQLVPLEEAELALWDAGPQGDAPPQLRGIAEIDIPVVALVPEQVDANSVVAAGARGVVVRERVDVSLIAALQAVRCGLTVLDTSIATQAARSRRHIDPLTSRESEVLGLLTEGMSNKRIARALGISEHTAKFHVNGILGKLDADTRTEAVVRAVRYGLVML